MVFDKQLNSVVAALESERVSGRRLTRVDRIVQLRKLAEAGGIRTMELLLPLALSLNNEPFHLRDHFMFSPLFNAAMPKNMVWMTARQVGKSQSIAARGVMLANSYAGFRLMYLTPLYEQIRRFSSNYVRPLIDQSPIRSLWSGTNTDNSVLQRTFKNRSLMLFSFALLDASRVRGASVDGVSIDEVQDFDPAHIPIVFEAMSHSKFAVSTFTGTPKSLENPLSGYFRLSSQAEWIIPCRNAGCRAWNIPSREFHIDKMIGPWHDGISERCPGTVCYKCQRSVNPRDGHWVHRYPDRRFTSAGYHVPQIILPLHYARQDKWAELRAKREGWGNTSVNTFYNEVLGEPVDAGQKLVSETDLRKASVLDWFNNPTDPNPEIFKLLPHYKHRILSVDWGGGGEQGVSFTVLALLGVRPDDKIDVLWGKRLVLSQEHLVEAKEIRYWMHRFKADMLSHDYTGAGIVRETVLVQAGLPLERVMPIQYIRTAAQSLIRFVPATVLHGRSHYRLDKPRSLLYTCQGIKLGLVRFFKYDSENEKNPGLMKDFLALVEEKTESRLAGDIYTITRNLTMTDDFAHAVNIGCAAIWHTYGWPNYAEAASIARISRAQIVAAGAESFGWENDPSMQGIFDQP